MNTLAVVPQQDASATTWLVQRCGRIRLKARRVGGNIKYQLCWYPLNSSNTDRDERRSVNKVLGLPPTAAVSEKDAIAAAWKFDADLGQDLVATPAQANGRLAQLLDAYARDLDRRGSESAYGIKLILVWLKAEIGQLRVSDLDTPRLTALAGRWQKLKNPRSTTGKPYAAATIRYRCAWLVAAMKFAEEQGAIRKHQVPAMPRFARADPRDGFLEPEEFFGPLGHEARGVLAQYGLLRSRRRGAPVKNARHYADGTEWLYVSATRKEEMRKLEWAWVGAGHIAIPKRITKNRKGRNLPLIGALAVIIERRRACRAYRDTDGTIRQSKYVFHQGDATGNGREAPGQMLRKNTLNSLFRRAIKDAAAVRDEVRHFIIHDLRRSGVRNLIRAGVDRKIAMAISGHTSEQVFDRYNIESDEDKRYALRRVELYTALRRQGLSEDELYARMMPQPLDNALDNRRLRVVQGGAK